jgi:hypothetical protein
MADAADSIQRVADLLSRVALLVRFISKSASSPKSALHHALASLLHARDDNSTLDFFVEAQHRPTSLIHSTHICSAAVILLLLVCIDSGNRREIRDRIGGAMWISRDRARSVVRIWASW